MAVAARPLPALEKQYRPTQAGIVARAAVAAAIAAFVFLAPAKLDLIWDLQIARAAIFAIIGLSINILTGYAGQISLGHQAFVGIGAFMSAFVASKLGWGFFVAVPLAGLTGGLTASILGLVALRIRGLYLALITLAFGRMAETTIFNWPEFTGGGAGAAAPRPKLFETNEAYAYFCLLVLGLFIVLDWRLAKSRAGRAIVSVRNNERVAATLGVNVTAYKLLAFILSGFVAGVAGSLFAHMTGFVQAADFNLIPVALTWVLMAVVGGLGSRAGVVIGSAFFAMFAFLANKFIGDTVTLPIFGEVFVAALTPLIGAILLLVTLTLYPGGLGQQLLPIRRWLAGGPFIEHKRKHSLAELVDEPELAEVERAEESRSEELAAEIFGEGSAPAEPEASAREEPAPTTSEAPVAEEPTPTTSEAPVAEEPTATAAGTPGEPQKETEG